MIPIILLTQTACNLNNINADNWISISSMVLLATFAVGLIIYNLSSLLPSKNSKKIKNTVIYEFGEGIISLILFLSLISLVYASCSVGAGLSGDGSNYQNIFQADEYYIGNLLFVKGPALITDISFQGISLSIDGNIVSLLVGTFTSSLNKALGSMGTLYGGGSGSSTSGSGSGGAAQIGGSNNGGISGGFGVYLENEGDVIGVFDAYADVYVSYATIVLISFGLLFFLYFLFPIIQLLAFTLLVPVALIFRSFFFVGPKIREISNTLLALAIAFYIVFPLTISMNIYIINWVFCTTPASVCNPYVQYTGNYKIAEIPIGQLFKQNTVQFLNYGGISFNLPTNFYSSLATNGGGVGSALTSLLEGIVTLPNQIASISTQVSEYFFESVLLVAIDFMITIGFAEGLTRALETIPQIIHNE